jgi:hypothetical protein
MALWAVVGSVSQAPWQAKAGLGRPGRHGQ